MSGPPQPPSSRNKSGYLAQDTIAAVATALGGPVAIVRLSGPDAFAVLARIAGAPSAGEARKLVRATLRHADGSPIDDALYVRFVGPESYTGEDVVEFQLHGSSVIATRLLETLVHHGIRQALPGEFSFRAVRNGKMSLAQAQGVADLITAANADAAALALEKASGIQQTVLRPLAEELRKLAMLSEIGIDFADQDVEEVALPSLKRRLKPLAEAVERLRASFSRGSRLQHGLRTVFAGLPNAGKSSFFNALLGEERSIVSNVPGTTRDVVHEYLTLQGRQGSVTLRLEDTAGLRTAQDSIEEIGIARTQKAVREADLILLLVDPDSNLERVRAEWELLDPSRTEKTLGFLTKSDLHRAPGARENLAGLGVKSWVETSVVTGQGIPEAVEAITEFAAIRVRREKGELLLTRLDHHDAAAAAWGHLSRAADAPEVALFASDIRQALHSLSPLIGDTVPDDILGRIFMDFCIGK